VIQLAFTNETVLVLVTRVIVPGVVMIAVVVSVVAVIVSRVIMPSVWVESRRWWWRRIRVTV
jgi:hypothetical protein